MNATYRLCFICGGMTPVGHACLQCGEPPDPDEQLQRTFAQPHLTLKRLRDLSGQLSWHVREAPHPGIGRWTFFAEAMIQPDLEFADDVPERFLPEEEMIEESFGPENPEMPPQKDP